MDISYEWMDGWVYQLGLEISVITFSKGTTLQSANKPSEMVEGDTYFSDCPRPPRVATYLNTKFRNMHMATSYSVMF